MVQIAQRTTYLSSISSFSSKLRKDLLYKAEHWHALSDEPYLSKHDSLDTCRCAFKVKFFIKFEEISMKLGSSLRGI